MKKVSENEYNKAKKRIEELLLLVDNNTPKENIKYNLYICNMKVILYAHYFISKIKRVL